MTATVSQIAEDLRPLATPVANLSADPDNARRGDAVAVSRSLSAFGQRKPVVVKRTGADSAGRPTGTVIAGNTTLAAALDLGWTEVAAVFVDDDPTTAKAYALADNRTAELATWDEEKLAETLRELSAADSDLTPLGWSEADLGDLLEKWSADEDDLPLVHDQVPATEARYAETEEQAAQRSEVVSAYEPRVGEQAGTVEMILVYTLAERAEAAAHINSARTRLGSELRGAEVVLAALRGLAAYLAGGDHSDIARAVGDAEAA